jgi:methyl-accepting chemotaxis protein
MKRVITAGYKRKRLNLAVKREFQLWLLIRIIGVAMLSSLVAVSILYFYSRQEISSTFYSAHIQLRRVSDLLFPVLATGSFVSLLSGLALALFLPQKIAGPIYRLEKSLKLIRKGDLTEEVMLRKHDTFKDLALLVNDTTADLRRRVQDIKAIQQELDEIIQTLELEQVRAVSARQNAAMAQLITEK